MDTNEYIIVNKSTLEKRIEELGKKIETRHQQIEKWAKEGSLLSDRKRSFWDVNDGFISECHSKIFLLKQILSQSTPLEPEIEKAFDESRRQHFWAGGNLYGDGYDEEEDLTDFKYKSSQEYIAKLKLDI